MRTKATWNKGVPQQESCSCWNTVKLGRTGHVSAIIDPGATHTRVYSVQPPPQFNTYGAPIEQTWHGTQDTFDMARLRRSFVSVDTVLCIE